MDYHLRCHLPLELAEIIMRKVHEMYMRELREEIYLRFWKGKFKDVMSYFIYITSKIEYFDFIKFLNRIAGRKSFTTLKKHINMH